MFPTPENKILADWREEAPAPAPVVVDGRDKAAWQLRLAGHFATETRLAQAAKKAQRQLLGAEVRLANKFYALALERSMQVGAGLNLAKFFVKDPPPPPRRCLPQEKRYFVEEPGPVENGVTCRRACVVNSKTGTSRYELPRVVVGGKTRRLCLFTHIDSGSVGLPFHLWLFTKGQVRGAVSTDWIHGLTNATKRALRRSSCWWVCVETMIAYNFPTGPYNGQGFFEVFKTCFERFWHQHDHTNPMFLAFYEGIVKDLGPMPPNFGSEAHLQDIWKLLPTLSCFRSKGKRVRMGRWWSWHDRHGEVRSYRSAMCTGLCLVGIVREWWPSYSATPFARRVPCPRVADDDDDPAQPAQQADEEVEPKTVAESNAKIEQKRAIMANTLHFVATTLASSWHLRIADAIFFLEEPMRGDVRQELGDVQDEGGLLGGALEEGSAVVCAHLVRHCGAPLHLEALRPAGRLPRGPR